MEQHRESGFNFIVVIILAALVIGGLVVWRLWPEPAPDMTPGKNTLPADLVDADAVWSFNGEEWLPDDLPQRCADPFTVKSPADVSLASSVLYPGQTRGGDYKPHGGLRFDGKKNQDITVRAPFDAKLISGSRYIEAGEVQYLFTFVNSCGIVYRLDHLLTLAPAVQKVAGTLPAATEDSRTTKFEQPIIIKSGETIATAVGHTKPATNVSFDFGLYDVRAQNDASHNPAFANAHANNKEFAWYSVCWLTWLSGDERAKVTSLPAADQTAGKTSDYCK